MNHCRWCGAALKKILAFGPMPLVNYFPTKKELKKEKRYPLTFCICRDCSLAQIAETIAPASIFRSYHYATGASSPLVRDLHQFSRELTAKKVLDIGSNDGTLLSAFQRQGSQVLGVEPAAFIPAGVPTIREFFSSALAKKIKKTHGTFDLVTAMHVLANIPNLHDFLRGVHEVLSDSGTFVVEVGSLENQLKFGQFDSIYHEHYSYFSRATLEMILTQSGFKIISMKQEKAQGGSIRITAKKNTSLQSVKPVHSTQYDTFKRRVGMFRKKLKKIITKDFHGKTVVGFGAPAKGVTLLNYCGLGAKDIAFVVDSTIQKQGRFVPGVHIPVFAEERLAKERIDAILVLSWNYQEEILKKIKRLVRPPVAVIIPFPKLEVV